MDIVFSSLPKNVDQLRSMPEFHLDSPFQTAALLVTVMCAWTESREACYEMLNILKGPQPLSQMDKNFIRDRMMDGKDKYIAKAYFKGATPQNNYTPQAPLTVTVTENPYSYDQEKLARLFLHTAGADNPRPITLRAKGNEWFVWEMSSLLVGIRKPVEQDPWA